MQPPRQISFLTIHPDFIEGYFAFGPFRSARETQTATFDTVNLRRFAQDARGSIDDKPYGGGDGMVMLARPLAEAVQSIQPRPYVILPSPSGRTWNQQEATNLWKIERPLLFVCARFAGVDQRFIDKYVDCEYSLGDYVISGGELASLTMVDTMLRMVPGVLGHEESATNDSFAPGMAGLLEYPLYTRPAEFEGKAVPSVLLSGDHGKITAWRQEQSKLKTQRNRPDLLAKLKSTH